MNIYFIGMLLSMIAYIIMGGIISKRVKTVDDFFVAGRNAPTYLIVGSLVASYCSTGLFMGDVGEAFAGFYTPFLIVVVMQVCGYILGSVFFGRYLRRSGVVTIPEFFGWRYNSKAIRVLAAIIAIFTMTVYLLSVMQGIGTLMNYVTGVDYNICIVLALISFSILTITSGSKGVLITDTIMFGVFSVASLIAVILIVQKLGGWSVAVQNVTELNPILFSWSGDLSYRYPTGIENMIWAIMNGITWISVCAVGPWQSSRYLMAKNEHVVIRSSVYAAISVFVIEFFVPTTAVFLNVYRDLIPKPTVSVIWAAMNLLPVIIAVILLTGVLAAGISSATTFLSLISSSVVNDILEVSNDKRKIFWSRISIVVVSAIVLVLSVFNPPQIYIILLLSGTTVVCSWLPVCIASVWSKKITKTGAFLGMLLGFIGFASVKIMSSLGSISLPIYLDAFVIGLIANIVGLVVGSVYTHVTDTEKERRNSLFIMPSGELEQKEIVKTKRTVLYFAVFGVCAALVLICFWVIPYYKALQIR